MASTDTKLDLGLALLRQHSALGASHAAHGSHETHAAAESLEAANEGLLAALHAHEAAHPSGATAE